MITSNDVRPAFESKINNWLALYYLEFDEMIIVARHFGWSDDRLNEWFEKKDTLQYTLGVVPTKDSMTNPKMAMSLLKNNKAMICTSCYE